MKMRRFSIGIVLLAALMSASCASMGSKKLVSSHTAYNDAGQLTITYIPQNDAGFYKSSMSAFSVGEAVGFG